MASSPAAAPLDTSPSRQAVRPVVLYDSGLLAPQLMMQTHPSVQDEASAGSIAD